MMKTIEQKQATNIMLRSGVILGVIFTAIAYVFWAFTEDTNGGRVLQGFLMIACCVPVFVRAGKATAALNPMDDYTYVQAFISVLMISYVAATVVTLAAWLPLNLFDPTYFETQLIVTQQELASENGMCAQVWLIIKKSFFLPVASEIVSMASIGIITGLFTSFYTRKKNSK